MGKLTAGVARLGTGGLPVAKPEGWLMKRLMMAALAVALVGLAGSAQGQEKKADPTGTWKWTVMFGDQTREQTVKLKLEGDKLTGSMLGRDNQETPISDAKYKDGEISFSVTRERGGEKRTTKYSGKLSGDTIKGKSERERGGETQSQDWVAKREKA
jgi:hypothetical protein